MNPLPDVSADQALLAQWVAAYGPAVRGYLLAMVRREDMAEDLLQETYRRAWEARHRYRERGAARAYLICIADRLVKNHARQSGRELQVEAEHWATLEPADGNAEPSGALTLSEDRQRLNAALDQIAPEQRRVLLLRYYGELSFAEIATTLGCPLNTALSHARRGLLALRKILAAEPSVER
jgi:RNA polymerase sigma-70 factor (ECF subfamily)